MIVDRIKSKAQVLTNTAETPLSTFFLKRFLNRLTSATYQMKNCMSSLANSVFKRKEISIPQNKHTKTWNKLTSDKDID